MFDIDLPVLPLPHAQEADIPCLVQTGSIGNEPVYFMHDPERPDRTDQ